MPMEDMDSASPAPLRSERPGMTPDEVAYHPSAIGTASATDRPPVVIAQR